MSHEYEIDSANNGSPAAGSPASPHAREYERAEEVLRQDSELFRIFTSAKFTEACDKVGQMRDYDRDVEATRELQGLVLVGCSGSGKSATVEFMHRGQLKRAERMGECTWQLVTMDGEPLESVGDTASHTVIPHATEMELEDGRTVVVLDLGGLADTRGLGTQVVVETTASLALEKMPRKTVVGLVVPWRRLVDEERLGVVPELWRMLACVVGNSTEVVAAEDEYEDGGAGAAAGAPGGAVNGGRSESAPGDGDDDEVPEESNDVGDAELQAQVQRIVALEPRVVLLVTKVPDYIWVKGGEGRGDEEKARMAIEARVATLETCVAKSRGGPGLMASRRLVISLMRNNCVLVQPERGGGRDVLQRVLDDDSIYGRPVRGSELSVARTLETQVECDKHALALWRLLRRQGDEVCRRGDELAETQHKLDNVRRVLEMARARVAASEQDGAMVKDVFELRVEHMKEMVERAKTQLEKLKQQERDCAAQAQSLKKSGSSSKEHVELLAGEPVVLSGNKHQVEEDNTWFFGIFGSVDYSTRDTERSYVFNKAALHCERIRGIGTDGQVNVAEVKTKELSDGSMKVTCVARRFGRYSSTISSVWCYISDLKKTHPTKVRMQADLDSQQARVNDLRRQQRDADGEVTHLQGELKQAERDVATKTQRLEDVVQTAREDVARLEAQEEALMSELDALRAELTTAWHVFAAQWGAVYRVLQKFRAILGAQVMQEVQLLHERVGGHEAVLAVERDD